MSTATVVVLTVLAIICIGTVCYFISLYNELVGVKKKIERNWSNIDVSLKQRRDELTKLIDACKRYMGHEDSTLKALVQAREQSQSAANNNDVKAVSHSEEKLRAGVAALNVHAEAYPDLKASNQFQQLMDAIQKLEAVIADRREHYNDSVAFNNTLIEQFPSNIVANKFGFKECELLTFEKSETKDVDISSAFGN